MISIAVVQMIGKAIDVNYAKIPRKDKKVTDRCLFGRNDALGKIRLVFEVNAIRLLMHCLFSKFKMYIV